MPKTRLEKCIHCGQLKNKVLILLYSCNSVTALSQIYCF